MTPDELGTWLGAAPRVLDGATGSELLHRGVASAGRLWGVGALLDDPDAVRRLHRDYAAAGADSLTAATFRVTPYALRRIALAPRARELATLAIALAREGAAEAGRACVVFASQPTLEDCWRPDLVPGPSVLAREHRASARILARAGADALLLETFNTAREARVAASEATATGLGVIVSFACRPGGTALSGERLEEAATCVSLPGVVAVGANCTRVTDLPAALSALRRGTGLPLVAYANDAWWDEDSPWLEAPRGAPESFAEAALAWTRLGARLVGGCCGTSPAHVAAIAARLRATG